MPARLVKTDSGGWKVRWRDGTKGPSGRYVEHASPVYDRKADALGEARRIDQEQQVRRELKRGARGRIVQLRTLLKVWGQHVVASKIARQPHVDEVERVLGALFDRRGWTTVVDLTTERVGAWRIEHGGRGTDKPLGQMKALLRYARDYLRQPVDPGVLAIPGRRGVRRRAQPPLLTADQVAQLLARARERGGADVEAILDHLATYGCRPVDACRLRVRDFNAVAGLLTLRETKNGETVTHPLLARHVSRYRELVEGRRGDDPLFRSPSGERWRTEKSAGQLLDWYTSNVSEHLLPRPQWGLYLLKDYAISSMDRVGIDDRTKALFTGHRSLAVFERYKATNQERATAALGLLDRPGTLAAPPTSAPQVRPDPK